MARESFGAAIGKLILQRRKALGLTQTQLAEDAFGSGTKTRRISELESGLVANPHPKTLDPLIVTLKISEIQIEECAKRTSALPDAELDRAYREARNLVEALARQFEHSNPDAGLCELDDFLRAKAKEWSELRNRIRDLDATEQNLVELKDKALLALDEGNFEAADITLATAEEIQKKQSTLVEVRKLAILRVSRGGVALISGKRNEATGHYIAAARYLEPFSEIEASDLLDEISGHMYETDRKLLRSDFLSTATLLNQILEYAHVQNDPVAHSRTNYRLSLIYRNASLQFHGKKHLN
jgi:transcriptional regulator with XRE-family HTH domain